MADATFQSKIYKTNNGDKLVAASGGEVDFESGSALKIAGNDRTSALATAPAAVAAGYKIARGEVTLDGSNPTSVTTGLATVVAAMACIKKATTPGDDPIAITVDYAGSVTAGQLDLYAWKTDGSDPTLVASTNNTGVISWIAIGT
ncbi:MAG: hypothetical protein K2Y22_04140 [Candidatus Obscuribacterales bacterium]|nr:hypothetical protein [Candidatus Obscuribacterales bacterium]